MSNETQSEQKFGLFEYVNDITADKKHIALQDYEFEKNFNTFMINRAMSYNIDCVFYANELNLYPDMDKRMVHDFLFLALKKGKRYGKWYKEPKIKELDAICEYYQVNRQQAEQILSVISHQELDHILTMKGGKNK